MLVAGAPTQTDPMIAADQPIVGGTICARLRLGLQRRVAPCPAPPPGECEFDVNPLVINAAGDCCPQSMCAQFHCISQCDADAGAHFGDAADDRHFYDCSRSPAARACYETIAGHEHVSAAECMCLPAECLPSSRLLRHQSSRCVLACRDAKHTGAGICPDWDDNHDLCNYYATFLCAASPRHGCDSTRLDPAPTPCEARCLAHPPPRGRMPGELVQEEEMEADPEDRLDRFLRCVTDTCSPGGVEDEA